MTKGAEQLSDLDLVFEDEEIEKKSDAIAISADIKFGVEGNDVAKKKVVTPTATSTPVSAATANPKPSNDNVHQLQKKEAPLAQTTGARPVTRPESGRTEDALIDELQEKMRQMELEMSVKLAVADFKTDILSDLQSDIKLLEFQMGGLLNRMYGKHPDLKQEILAIKKLMADFSQKKRK